MKIDPSKILGVGTGQTADKTRAKTGTPGMGDAFDALLTEAAVSLDKQPGSHQASGPASPMSVGGLNPLLNPALMGLESATSTSEVAATAPAAGQPLSAKEVETLLNAWDDYAAQLGKGGDLKSLWSRLDGMTGALADLKKKAGTDSPISPLLQELEILASTERFKFNRGDYL